MGVDYNCYLGIGRQMKIDYLRFDYDKFYQLKESLENQDLRLILTSQEYKGNICSTSLFVGEILFETDPRDGQALAIDQEMMAKLESSQNQPLRDKLIPICGQMEEAFEGKFGNFGLNLLVYAF